MVRILKKGIPDDKVAAFYTKCFQCKSRAVISKDEFYEKYNGQSSEFFCTCSCPVCSKTANNAMFIILPKEYFFANYSMGYFLVEKRDSLVLKKDMGDWAVDAVTLIPKTTEIERWLLPEELKDND